MIRSDAYHTGYEAYVQGVSRDANPYVGRGEEGWEWLMGWEVAAGNVDEADLEEVE